MSYNGVNNYLTTADGATFCTTLGKASEQCLNVKKTGGWHVSRQETRTNP